MKGVQEKSNELVDLLRIAKQKLLSVSCWVDNLHTAIDAWREADVRKAAEIMPTTSEVCEQFRSDFEGFLKSLPKSVEICRDRSLCALDRLQSWDPLGRQLLETRARNR